MLLLLASLFANLTNNESLLLVRSFFRENKPTKQPKKYPRLHCFGKVLIRFVFKTRREKALIQNEFNKLSFK